MEPIRVGLIGCGGFMRQIHLPNLLASGLYRVVATGDLNEEAAAQLAQQAGAAYSTNDVDRILGDDEIEAVIIATRHDSHAPLSAAAAHAGKHVLCEKPMGLGEAECRDVAARVREAGVCYTVGYNRGLAPLVEQAREIIGNSSAKRLIYHRIQAPFPASHWTHLAEVGGGRFVGEGCHIFDLLCELVPAPPTAIYAAGGTFLDPELVRIPDSGIVTITFADGSVGTTLIASDGCAQFPKESTEIYWAGQAIQIDDFARLVYRAATPGLHREVTLPAQDKGHRREVELFARAIREGSTPPNDPARALRAALVSFRVLDALASGQPVPISATEFTV